MRRKSQGMLQTMAERGAAFDAADASRLRGSVGRKLQGR
jgi:hypothetical protein